MGYLEGFGVTFRKLFKGSNTGRPSRSRTSRTPVRSA